MILVQKGVSAAPPQDMKAKVQVMCLCYGLLRIFLSKTQFWCRAYMIRTKNVLLITKFQLNFHVQNVIYGSNQEKELLQSRAENLSEL